MTEPMEMADFFAMEAGEYLERLDGMASSRESPVPEDFHGLSRSLRGSALMAGQKPIARVAGGLSPWPTQSRRGHSHGTRLSGSS